MRGLRGSVLPALLLAGWMTVTGLWSAPASADTITLPKADSFYVSPPGFDSTAPGSVLRTRSAQLTFYGVPTPVEATQALIRTTDTHGAPVTTATTVIASGSPTTAPTRPLIAYQIAIDGLASDCNPSYRLRTGSEGDLRVIVQLLQAGYAVVVTDHQGPRNAYGASKMSAHAVLDGIRAAESLPGIGLTGVKTPVGLWGYSGGAMATSWAAQLQPTYAPELNVVGVASGGTPADLKAAGKQMDGGPASSVFLMGVLGASREYPEVDSLRSLLNDRGREAEAVLQDKCVEPGAIAYPFRRLSDFTDVPDPLDDPRVQPFFEELKLGGIAPKAPVYLYHAVHDEGMPFAAAEQLRRDWCARGAKVWFEPNPFLEHLTLAVAAIPGVLDFFADRFAGAPAPNNCRD